MGRGARGSTTRKSAVRRSVCGSSSESGWALGRLRVFGAWESAHVGAHRHLVRRAGECAYGRSGEWRRRERRVIRVGLRCEYRRAGGSAGLACAEGRERMRGSLIRAPARRNVPRAREGHEHVEMSSATQRTALGVGRVPDAALSVQTTVTVVGLESGGPVANGL